MALAKITGQGLRTIAILVALLWACILSEQLMLRSANRETARALRDIHSLQLKHRAEPVSHPVPHRPHPVRPTLG